MLKTGAAACVDAVLSTQVRGMTGFAGGRPPVSSRNFRSGVVDSAIVDVTKQIADPQLAAIFERCFPNTLDTTVFPHIGAGESDTYIVTGDIDAMWLRDSSAQVWPYLRFARSDKALASLLQGVVRRQSRLVLLDPYANAFTRTRSDAPLKWAIEDHTHMVPGVAERKWEIDSLCYVVRLAHGYWTATGDRTVFNAEWQAAAWKIVATFREQQRLHDQGPYSFQRQSLSPSDTVPLSGFGNPARPVGLIHSMFRPSDDACIYPLFIPANLFALQALAQLRELATAVVSDTKLAATCDELSSSIRLGLQQHGAANHATFGDIWAYEVDGFGNKLLMDDANAPGLLSLPYLGCCKRDDPRYRRTRQFALSEQNPYFFRGHAAEGIGGPHIGLGYVWPLSIIMRALTSTDDLEILQCLRTLRNTTAGTGFMHESFQQDDPANFTRAWFAWANTLFGELILHLVETKPSLLREKMTL